jgi:SAM-dependent methyltransferase
LVVALAVVGIGLRSTAVAQWEEDEHYEDSRSLAPFVPTPMEVVDKMLEVAEVTKDDVVYDLGCGDGRIVVRAAEKYGATGVGVDYNPQRIAEAKARVVEFGVEKKVEIVLQDAMTMDLSKATVITLYLLTQSNKKLKPILEKYLDPGDRVVSHDFDMEGWKAKKIVTVPDEYEMDHTVYLWVMGEHK